MSAKVTLSVEKGPDKGRVEVFEERESLTIGRGVNEDCNFLIPDTPETRTVGRYHCMMEIVPPEVVVRDFGSLNGTFLNGKEIGRREAGMSAEEGWKMKSNEFEMKDGNTIELSNEYRIAVSIYTPEYCAECCCELPENVKDRIKVENDLFLCQKCYKRKKQNRDRLYGKERNVLFVISPCPKMPVRMVRFATNACRTHFGCLSVCLRTQKKVSEMPSQLVDIVNLRA